MSTEDPELEEMTSYTSELDQALKLLDQCTDRLRLIQQTLRKARKVKSIFDQTLQAIRAPFSPIQYTPPEILHIIFKYYIYNNPTHIRRLLLVCRSWYITIINNETFWTYIKIEPISYFEEFEKMKERARYVDTCLQRSGSLPIDVHVNYSGVVNISEDMKKSFQLNLQDIITREICDKDDVGEDLFQETNDWFFEHSIHLPDVIILRFQKLFLRPILLLIGDQGQNMARWSSFVLHISEGSWYNVVDCEAIWDLLSHPSPLLSTLSITGTNPTLSKELSSAFPSLPNLHILDVRDSYFDYTRLPFLQLNELHVSVTEYSDLEEIFRCKSLRILHMDMLHWHSKNQRHAKATLPNLRELHIHSLFREEASFNYLDLPALDLMSMCCSFPSDPQSISTWPWVKHVPRISLDLSPNMLFDIESLETKVRKYVPPFTSVKVLYVEDKDRDAVTACLAELGLSGISLESSVRKFDRRRCNQFEATMQDILLRKI